MGNDYISLDELVYYRNLLALEVGDRIQWRINSFIDSSTPIEGVITAIYPEGKGQYIGIKNAFLTAFAFKPMQNYSVALTNPTITKLETDK